MKLEHRIGSARALLDQARRELEEYRAGDASSSIRETLASLDYELHELQALCDDAETRISVLEIIAAERDPEKALVASLRYLTRRMGIDASGLRLREGDDFPYFTTEGFSDQFVLDESHLCQRDHSGETVRDARGEVVLECMCGRVIRGLGDPSRPFFTRRGSFWTNSTSDLLDDTTEEERLGPTRNRCHAEGFESVALIPLTSDDETFGLLQFNGYERGRFTPQTIALLEDLSLYLAHLLA